MRVTKTLKKGGGEVGQIRFDGKRMRRKRGEG